MLFYIKSEFDVNHSTTDYQQSIFYRTLLGRGEGGLAKEYSLCIRFHKC